jgi:teichuronic acid biosynthesis glycosyltransferase TuaC
MRVLHITHLYPRHYDGLLGIAMHKQIMALEAQGCMNKVISPIPWTPFLIKYLSQKWKLYSQVPFYNIINGIEVYHPRYLEFPKAFLFSYSGMRMYLGIQKLVKVIEETFPFDIIHAHMGLPDGYAGMRVSLQFKKPLIVTIQGTDVDITANRSKRCLLTLRNVLNYASKVIAPSPRLAKAVASKFGIEPCLIGYGINILDVIRAKSELLSNYKNWRILLSVSRLIKTKGIDFNIYALKSLVNKHKNLLYIIVGDGPERYNLEKLVQSLDLTKYVRFAGAMPYNKVMEYMAICEVFTLPSWQETFGLVYIEAMAHGKPVVAIQGQGVDGIVIHGETGLLVKPRDINSLVEALDFLLSHPDEARAMGERAREVVLANYTWEKNAEKTIEVYREVLNER